MMRRVVIDSNLWISALISPSGAPAAVVRAALDARFTVVMADVQRGELDDVLARDALVRRFRLPADDIARVRRFLAVDVVEPQVAPSPIPVRDPKDEAILAAALHGGADYLVTGDADLLVLAEEPALGRLRIVTPADFLVALDAE